MTSWLSILLGILMNVYVPADLVSTQQERIIILYRYRNVPYFGVSYSYEQKEISGKGWYSNNDREIAKDLTNMLTDRKEELIKKRTRLDRKLRKSKNKNIDKIKSEFRDVTAMISDIDSSISELAKMGETKEMIFTFNNVGPDVGPVRLSTKKNGNDVIVVINYTYSDDPDNPNIKLENQLHEATHGYQFLTRKFTQSETNIETSNFTFTVKSKGDAAAIKREADSIYHSLEIQAYQRQFSLNGPFRAKINTWNDNPRHYPLQAEKYSEITVEWLLNIKDKSGNFIYRK